MTVSYLGKNSTTGEASFQGLSTDEKPSIIDLGTVHYDIPDGSTFLELDTSKIYVYDSNSVEEENEGWWLQVSGTSSSGINNIQEVDLFENLPATGESNIIYITTDDNKIYRWAESEYLEVSPASLSDSDATELTDGSLTTLHTHNLNNLNEKSYNNLDDKPDLTLKANKSDVLEKDNDAEFIPTGDYNPATKKYVDDSVPDISSKADKSNVLEKNNTTEFIPDSDYEPATKKYVDDNAGVASFPSMTGSVGQVLVVDDIESDIEYKSLEDIPITINMYGGIPTDILEGMLGFVFPDYNTTLANYLGAAKSAQTNDLFVNPCSILFHGNIEGYSADLVEYNEYSNEITPGNFLKFHTVKMSSNTVKDIAWPIKVFDSFKHNRVVSIIVATTGVSADNPFVIYGGSNNEKVLFASESDIIVDTSNIMMASTIDIDLDDFENEFFPYNGLNLVVKNTTGANVSMEIFRITLDVTESVNDYSLSYNKNIKLGNPISGGFWTTYVDEKELLDVCKDNFIYYNPASLIANNLEVVGGIKLTTERVTIEADLGYGLKNITTSSIKFVARTDTLVEVKLDIKKANLTDIIVLYTATNVEVGSEPTIEIESAEGSQVLKIVDSDTANGVYRNTTVPTDINPGTNKKLVIKMPPNASGTEFNLAGAIILNEDTTFEKYAQSIKVVDTDSNFAATNLETVLKELSDRITALEP